MLNRLYAVLIRKEEVNQNHIGVHIRNFDFGFFSVVCLADDTTEFDELLDPDDYAALVADEEH